MSDGIVFGGYYLLGRLAAGGMAEVFLSKELAGGNRLLAIKKMLPRLSEDPNFVSMFIDEARIAGGLSHPNICKITDQGHHDNQLFIAMEFIHGKDLRVLKRRARKRGESIPPRIVAYTIAKIAEALDFAHRKQNELGQPENIVHRDVSPQNILLSYDGVPKLIDFGVAKAKHRLAQTRVGVVKGKFAYMSPEQATGQALDARTDIFALGVVLYELLTGELPFKGSSDLSTLKRIARADYVPPAEVNHRLPGRLSAIIDKALQRDPAARYPTAAALAGDLQLHLADERRDITESLLSSYLRRLFRDDYIREMARIKSFQTIDPPADHHGAARPGGRQRSDTTRTETHPEPTAVSGSQFLAAGYDDGPPSGEGPTTDDDNAPATTRLRFDTREVDDAIVLLSDEANEPEPHAPRPDAPGADAGPARGREAPTLLETETTPVVEDEVTETRPGLDPGEVTETRPGLDADEVTETRPGLVADDQDRRAPGFDGKTVEFRFPGEGGADPSAERLEAMLDAVAEEAERDEVEIDPEDAVAEEAERDEVEIEPEDAVVEEVERDEVEIDPGDAAVEASTGGSARELGGAEAKPIQRSSASPGGGWTQEEELPETRALMLEPKVEVAPDDDFDIDEPGAGGATDLPPDRFADALTAPPPGAAERQRLLTNVEIALLFLAAALGLALVVGVYLYASTAELNDSRTGQPAAAVQPR